MFNKVPSLRRRWFVGLLLLAVGLIFAVGALLWQAAELSSLPVVSEEVARLKPFAGVIRLLLIAMLAAFWPRLVDLAVRSGRIDATDRSRLLALRWRVIIWLSIIELMIGQDLFGQFLSETSGPIA